MLECICNAAAMCAKPISSTLTIGELEASFAMYCKALRILIRQGKTREQIERSLCWQRLTVLHHCLPRQYKDPAYLYIHLKREISA